MLKLILLRSKSTTAISYCFFMKLQKNMHFLYLGYVFFLLSLKIHVFSGCFPIHDRANLFNMVALRRSLSYYILVFLDENQYFHLLRCVFEIRFTPKIAHIMLYVQPHMLHMEKLDSIMQSVLQVHIDKFQEFNIYAYSYIFHILL